MLSGIIIILLISFQNIESHYISDDLDSEILDHDSFKSITVQCWLDLFLQIFKTFLLNPLVGV